jgi:hypothetical protein
MPNPPRVVVLDDPGEAEGTLWVDVELTVPDAVGRAVLGYGLPAYESDSAYANAMVVPRWALRLYELRALEEARPYLSTGRVRDRASGPEVDWARVVEAVLSEPETKGAIVVAVYLAKTHAEALRFLASLFPAEADT